MFHSKAPDEQPPLWIATSDLPTTPEHTFYQRLDRALRTIGFGDTIRARCAPYYEPEGQGGRPGIDPEVYFKMLMIGFFENLASERGIAARCADSFAIRAFLHYALTERTPDHSTLSVIRQRLAPEVYQEVFALVLRALKQHKLLRGKKLTIDSSVLEANASLRSLAHRLTGAAYREYVAQLAAAAGVDPADPAAVRRFDQKRPGRKTSNQDWVNPHDPDAKVGPTKTGSTKMIYKPEHTVDLETGAIVDVEIQPGDAADLTELPTKVSALQARLNTALGKKPNQQSIALLVADKGYYHVDALVTLQAAGIRTAMSDPLPHRRVERLKPRARAAVRAAQRTVQGPRVRALARRRGELGERSFAHVLDRGGARRTTLRGRANIRKRYLIQAACANLSLLMRKLCRIGTPKQAVARGARRLRRLVLRPWWVPFRLRAPSAGLGPCSEAIA